MNLQTRIPISNGTSIPCVGFGTWKTPNEEAEKSVAEALRVGYRHIDTATTLTPRRPTATRLVSARQSQNPALREKTFS